MSKILANMIFVKQSANKTKKQTAITLINSHATTTKSSAVYKIAYISEILSSMIAVKQSAPKKRCLLLNKHLLPFIPGFFSN